MANVLVAAVVVFLLSTAGVHAALFTDLPADHWGYRALGRLQSAGLLDHSLRGPFRADQPYSRYELSLLLQEVIGLTAILQGERPEVDLHPFAAFKAEYVAAQIRLEQAQSLAVALSPKVQNQGVDHAQDGARAAALRYGQEVSLLYERYDALIAEAEPLVSLSMQPAGSLADPEAFKTMTDTFKRFSKLVDASIDRVAQKAAPDQASEVAAAFQLDLAAGIDMWMKTWASPSERGVRMQVFPGTRLAADIEALIHEFRQELRILAPAPISTSSPAHSQSLAPRDEQAADGDEPTDDPLDFGQQALHPLLQEADDRLGAYAVDIDRLRELSVVESKEGGGRSDGSSLASQSDGGFPSSLIDRSTLEADYSWGGPKDGERARANVGVGLRIGENTSVRASFSSIYFDDEGGQRLRTDLGEAELSFRF